MIIHLDLGGVIVLILVGSVCFGVGTSIFEKLVKPRLDKIFKKEETQ